MPEMDVIREHDVDVLVVLTREHGIPAIDFARENSHSFVLGGRAVQGDEPKQKEIGGLNELRHNHLAIVSSERRIINVCAVVISKANEAGVFNTVALRRRGGKDNSLRQRLVALELNFVVR